MGVEGWPKVWRVPEKRSSAICVPLMHWRKRLEIQWTLER